MSTPSDIADPPVPSPAGTGIRAMISRLKEHGDLDTWMRAGSAFAIRVMSAAVLFVTQVLLARWMGSYEFGVYVYTAALVVMVGDLTQFGFGFLAQRAIPEYRHSGQTNLLRGFLRASRLFVIVTGTTGAILSIGLVQVLAPYLQKTDPVVVSIAAATLPAYALASLFDGVARSFDRVHVALLPTYIVTPLLIILFMGVGHELGYAADAVTAMSVAVGSAWIAMIGQAWFVFRTIAREVEPGPAEYRMGAWIKSAAQIFAAWSFISLFTYVDVLVLNAFSAPDKVAIYYASVKTLALTSFIAYAVAAVYGHKFVSAKVSGNTAELDRLVGTAVALTFWPSLLVTGGLLICGRFILSLFGPDFVVGYDLMFILSIGLMIRASVGPAERMLTMLGEQRFTAGVYAAAFLANLTLALLLVPKFGLHGAAISLAAGTTVEAALLALAVRRRLGLNSFIIRRRHRSGAAGDGPSGAA